MSTLDDNSFNSRQTFNLNNFLEEPKSDDLYSSPEYMAYIDALEELQKLNEKMSCEKVSHEEVPPRLGEVIPQSQFIELTQEKLIKEKNQILAEFVQQLENSKNRAIARLMESGNEITDYYSGRVKRYQQLVNKQDVLRLNPSKVRVIHHPEAQSDYEWEARINLLSTYLSRHGHTQEVAKEALQEAFVAIIECVTI